MVDEATINTQDLIVPTSWIDRIAEQLHGNSNEDLALKAFRHLVHADLKAQVLKQGPLVLELDRTMSRVPWEMLQSTAGAMPLGVSRTIARQLRRTSYSRQRRVGAATGAGLKALVIGNPDNSLPGAAVEASSVARDLQAFGCHTTLLMGGPDALGLGPYHGIEPVHHYDVVDLIQTGVDFIHYSGPAFFDPEYPERSGWRFADAVLAPSTFESLEHPPRLIFANAYLSGSLINLSAGVSGGVGSLSAEIGRPPGDPRVVATLADEFLRTGVANYIGTAWKVPEQAATIFAECFYAEYLGVRSRQTLGAAVLAARRSLFERRVELAGSWAAYQHYGDPMRTLID